MVDEWGAVCNRTLGTLLGQTPPHCVLCLPLVCRLLASYAFPSPKEWIQSEKQENAGRENSPTRPNNTSLDI